MSHPGGADTLVWIGQDSIATSSNPQSGPAFGDPAGWFDQTTNAPATVAPGPGNTLLFAPGEGGSLVLAVNTYPENYGPYGTMIAEAGAAVFMLPVVDALTVAHYTFADMQMQAGACVSIGGLTVHDLQISPGATLDIYGARVSATTDNSLIDTLDNQGGAFIAPVDPWIALGVHPLGAGEADHPEFVQYSDPSRGSALTYCHDIYSGESVLPTADTLEIALGTIAQGASLAPLIIGARDAGKVPGAAFVVEVTATSDAGFRSNLAAATVRGGDMADYLGAVTPNTAVLGSHTLTATMTDGSGDKTQTLVVTETVTGQGGVPCFTAATMVLTKRGQRSVGTLCPGDSVETPGGMARVKWVGHKRVRLDALPVTERLCAAPILIRPGAFGEGVPRVPVKLSPDHAVLVEGVLIPIRLLVNGKTIVNDLQAKTAHYVHVELEQHGVILVAGLPCESFLDTGNRGQFDMEAGTRPMFDTQREGVDGLTATLAAYYERGAAPLCVGEVIVAPVRERLANLSRALA